MGLIGILLGLLLAGGGWFFHLRSAKKANASAAWPTTQGTVTACQVVHKTETSSDGDTDVYYAKPIYTYAVGGAPYTGDRISFGGQNRFYSEKAAQAIVDRYPAGSTVQVRYNPANPRECALESRKPPMMMPIVLSLVGVIFIVAGVGLMA